MIIIGDSMEKVKAIYNGEEIEVVTKLDEDEYGDDVVLPLDDNDKIDLDDTLDLTEELEKTKEVNIYDTDETNG